MSSYEVVGKVKGEVLLEINTGVYDEEDNSIWEYKTLLNYEREVIKFSGDYYIEAKPKHQRVIKKIFGNLVKNCYFELRVYDAEQLKEVLDIPEKYYVEKDDRHYNSWFGEDIDTDIDISGVDTVLVFYDGRIVEFRSSEWGFITLLKE